MSLSTNVTDLAVAVGTQLKATRTAINGNAADLSALTTSEKSNLVAALNSLHAELQSVAGGAAGINDTATGLATTWSSQKISNEVQAAITALVNGAPGALDTIKELADALTGQTDTITAIQTALANRVRYDAAQTLDSTEQALARANIGAGTSSLTIGTGADNAKAGNWVPTAAEISDSTSTGIAVLTAASQAAARSAIGAGTSSLVIGTAAGNAKAGNYVPTWSEITSKPTTFAPSAHTHASTEISDSTTVGRSVLSATDAAAARSAIGAGTGNSNLTIGTTASTAKAGNWVPAWTDVTGKPTTFSPSSHTHGSADISDSSTIGRTILTAADAGAVRTAIGAGTSSLIIGTTAGTAAAGNDSRIVNAVPNTRTVAGKPLSGNVTLVASDVGAAAASHTHTAADISDASTVGAAVLTAASATAARTAIGAGTSNLAIGTTSSTAKAGNWFPTSAQITDTTATGVSIMTAASAAAVRSTLAVPSTTDVGDTNVNYVAQFEAALA